MENRNRHNRLMRHQYFLLMKQGRRTLRLKRYDYSWTGRYFVTFCALNREMLFGHIDNGEMFLNDLGKIVSEYWLEIPGYFSQVRIERFVVMPNHFHGVLLIDDGGGKDGLRRAWEEVEPASKELIIRRRKMLLAKVIGRFKMQSAKRINEIRKTPGTPVWQRNYYEHIIRDEEEFNHVREYITNNPKEWDLDIESQ